MTFTAVIPTYNRERDLAACLDSILNQSLHPDEILIIDDGDLSGTFIQEWSSRFVGKSSLVYRKKDFSKERRGLSESKNLGLVLTSHNILFFLDDDVVLEPGFFKDIISVWEQNHTEKLLAGVGGVIKNSRKKSSWELAYNNIFGLTSELPWDVNEVGFQVWDDHVSQTSKGFYMHGGVSSYNRSIVQALGGFKVYAGGRTALEDVELSLRAKNQGHFFYVVPGSRVVHNVSKSSREGQYHTGIKESVNRKLIYNELCKHSLLRNCWFVWSNIGWVLRQFLAGHFYKGAGMIVGIFK